MLFRAFPALRRALSLGCLLAVAPVLDACDPPVRPPPSDAGPRADTGRHDSGTGDGGDDLDGGDEVDADVDGGGVDPGSCEYDAASDLFELATDLEDRPRVVSIAPSPDGFGVAYAAISSGFQQIWRATIPTSGAPGGAEQLTTDFARSLEPTVAFTGDTWLYTWFSNRDGSYEIYSRPYWPAGHPTDPGRPAGPIQRLTTNGERDDNPAMAALEGGSRIAWVTQTMAGIRSASTAELDELGAMVGSPAPVALAGRTPTTPTLVVREGGYVLAFADTTDALLVPLDASGVASAPIVLSSEHNADGAVDLSLGLTGGVAVFGTSTGGIRPEVHAIALDETGAVASSERSLSIGTETGRDASVAALLGGYAVAYRALDANVVRVVFLSLTLDEVARLDLAAAAADGGRLTIRASQDGAAMLVAWADRVGPTEVHVRAARIRCN